MSFFHAILLYCKYFSEIFAVDSFRNSIKLKNISNNFHDFHHDSSACTVFTANIQPSAILQFPSEFCSNIVTKRVLMVLKNCNSLSFSK